MMITALYLGLRKVSDDMKTHKNPALRTGPQPFKPSPAPKPSSQPTKPGAAAAPKAQPAKPPKCVLDGKKWTVVSYRFHCLSDFFTSYLNIVSVLSVIYSILQTN